MKGENENILRHHFKRVDGVKNGRIAPLRIVLKNERVRQCKKVSRITLDSGMQHPAYYNFETAKTLGITPALRILDELGLELQIVKKKEE